MKLIILLLTIVLCCLHVSGQAKFSQLCSSNPSNAARRCDRLGCGHYRAKRYNGFHKGLDISCRDGATVYAPFDLVVSRRSRPYGNNNAIDDGITVRGQVSGLCVSLFYLRPVKVSGTVKKGQRLGTMLPMQRVYPGITSHIHVQMCDLSDPTRFF